VIVQELGQSLLEMLRPGCDRIEIAGSIRRGKVQPKDIELVAIPKIHHTADLFGTEYHTDMLSERIQDFCGHVDDEWGFDQALKRNGPKYKRLRHARGVCCDLFITDADQWGAQFVIRTGPAEFSHMLVTRALRLGMKQEDGRLWRIHRDDTKTVIPTPEEVDYLKALGLPWIEPEQRGKATA